MAAETPSPTVVPEARPLLVVDGLCVSVRQPDRTRRPVVQDVSFAVAPGRVTSLVGESGSGKTMIGRAALQLLPQVAGVDAGKILLAGENLLDASPAAMRRVRGRAIGMVFQEPMVSLNPALTVGVQMTEALKLHFGLDEARARERCLAMLERVRIADPRACLRAYPHQFSGGMRQRIMLASVLVMGPKLLIADEPTTALDAIIQKEVMDIMISLTRELGTSVLLVSHDLGMVCNYADEVVLLRQGRIMEAGPTRRVLLEPRHPYARDLLDSMPIRGLCAVDRPADGPLVEVSALQVEFAQRAKMPWRRAPVFKAVDGVDLVVRCGETVALVGESGSGKTTLGRALVRLNRGSGGSIRFDGRDVAALRGRELIDYRLQTQMVFQDPFSSLDPRMRLTDIVAQGLRHMAGMRHPERLVRARAMLAEVGLPDDFGDRFPHELSGGQRQRVCIARAIVARPRFLVADEPVAALDVTTQKQVLLLLAGLQAKFGFSCLFISHDLSVVEQVADRVVVMYRGLILEEGPRTAIYDDPRHPYTLRLLQATPRLARAEAGGYRLRTQIGSSSPAPEGWAYFNHGSVMAAPLSQGRPVMVEVESDHRVACVRV
ncbi:ABC transporter ATP-binding protein [Luteimonas marina]|uniref:ABC transporter ATP-binding protein n=1 Tax=Luteimonas marina TaxID=488485 RepID=A0A5C5TZK1_9GAMM|nr:ABC transporter ATP-binding protein [Luteimonas marina]TWT18712.1 ABC transporter ATP-binding protein [Luteimonas marina]